MKYSFLIIAFLMSCSTVQKNPDLDHDPYLWLEEVESSQALEFVQKENEKKSKKRF